MIVKDISHIKSPTDSRLYKIKRYFVKLVSRILFPFSRKLKANFRDYFTIKKLKKHEFTGKIPNLQEVPIYIISFNRLSYVKQMVEWLEKYNMTNIHIIDNNSNYPPLLQYLKKSPHHVHHMDKNYGHLVFWQSGKFDDIIKNHIYVVTDPDIAPNLEMPADFMSKLFCLLCEYPSVTKVGLALDISDLPNNPKSDIVKKWESQFWKKRIKDELEIYKSDLDTTFALYRPGVIPAGLFYDAIRVAGDFTAKHLPWYFDESGTDEDEFYKKNLRPESASWIAQVDEYKTKINKKA